MTEAKGLHSTLVVNCVLNSFLSSTAILLNIITIQALRKTPSLSKPLKTLLLSLAVSDLGVGFLAQPTYVAVLVMKIKQNAENRTYDTIFHAFFIQNFLFVFASFFGVFTLTVDRFLAIHLHLRYQELVTHKRVVAVVSSVWVLSVLIALLALKWIQVLGFIFATINVVFYVTTGLFYCKIYAVIRHHANQINVLQQSAQNENMVNAARLRKTAAATFYVYLVFLVCYLPAFCAGVARIHGETPLLLLLSEFGYTFVYLNSSLNPLIYCWKMRNIRQTVKNILKSIFPCGTWIEAIFQNNSAFYLGGKQNPYINAIKCFKTWCTKTCDAICSGLFFSCYRPWNFKDYLKNCLLKFMKPRKSWKMSVEFRRVSEWKWISIW